MLQATEKTSLPAITMVKQCLKEQYLDLIRNAVVLAVWLSFAIVFLNSYSYASQVPEDFSIITLDGKAFTLSSYQQKKPVFLFFWATWCPICKKEIPRIKALHHEYGDQIEILAINVGYNDSLENIYNYQQRYNTNFPIAYDKHSDISQNYGVFGTPMQVVIDIDGKLRYQGHQFPEGLENVLPMLSTSEAHKDDLDNEHIQDK